MFGMLLSFQHVKKVLMELDPDIAHIARLVTHSYKDITAMSVSVQTMVILLRQILPQINLIYINIYCSNFQGNFKMSSTKIKMPH